MHSTLAQSFLLGLLLHTHLSSGLPGRQELRKRDDTIGVAGNALTASDGTLIEDTLRRISPGIVERAGIPIGGAGRGAGGAGGAGRGAGDAIPGYAQPKSGFDLESDSPSPGSSSGSSSSSIMGGPSIAGSRDGSPAAQGSQPVPYQFQQNEVNAITLVGAPTRKELDDAITGRIPDNGRTLEASSYPRSTDREVDIDGLDTFKYLQPGNKYGMPAEAKDTWTMSIVKSPGESNKEVLTTKANGERGTLVVNSMDTRMDDALPDQRARMSDLIMANWREAAGKPEKVPQLNYLLYKDVTYYQKAEPTIRRGPDGVEYSIDLNTPLAMSQVRQRMELPEGTPSMTLSARADGKEKECFDLMGAQTHVSRVHLMLRDYHQELKDLRISKIHLHFSTKEDSAQDIVIEFGRL